MRVSLLLLPLVLAATPAAAQSAPAADDIQVPKELTDPAMIDRLTEVMKALSTAFLEMPIGQVEAAVEGRAVTEADKRRTVRSESGMTEDAVRQHIAASKPAMQAGMKALAAALPAMMKGMAEAGKELEKAGANLPQPGYPKQ